MATDTTKTKRKFRVGDCIIINNVEQPSGRMVVVVSGDDGEQYECQYLNASREFDSYNKPPMRCDLGDATRIEEFGVVIRAADGEYWCEQRGESRATYRDGKTRLWQEHGPRRYKARPELAAIVWPF